jgi:RimJ/RimL family protein N-acetyltransferase
VDTLVIIRATADDSTAIFEWRNDGVTRAASASQEYVPWGDHERWFADILVDPTRFLYVAWDGGERVGLCRFDKDAQVATAEVSINLNPAYRGRGYAARILGAAIERYRADSGTALRLTATIRPENVASLRTFAALGFVAASSEPGLDHLVLDY